MREDAEPSDCFQAIMMALLALHLLLGGLVELLWRARRFTRALGALERAMSALALMGTSNAALLFLLSAGSLGPRAVPAAAARTRHYGVLGVVATADTRARPPTSSLSTAPPCRCPGRTTCAAMREAPLRPARRAPWPWW